MTARIKHEHNSTNEYLIASRSPEHININMHTLNNYSSRNHSYCKSVMQMVVVACLGLTNTTETIADDHAGELTATLLSRRRRKEGNGDGVSTTA